MSEPITERQFNEQLALWDQALGSSNPGLTEKYLYHHPSGIFSELAELRLDQLLAKQGERKVTPINSSDNPYSKGTATAIFNYAVGDRFTFVEKDYFTGIEKRRYTEVVTTVTEYQTEFNGGKTIIDAMGNDLVSSNARFLSPAQFYPLTYAIGHKWNTTFKWARNNGKPSTRSLDFKVVARESLKSSFGIFNAFRIEGTGRVLDGSTTIMKYWIDPERCGRIHTYENVARNHNGGITNAFRTELVEFTLARRG